VLCADEKSQVEALDGTQPLLPMRPGQVEAAHARLQAAWHDIVVRGAIVGKCIARHRASQFRQKGCRKSA
jgi:hypothetical protein